MATTPISATIEIVVRAEVQELADKEKRSFSWMVNHLLETALKTIKK